MPQVHRSHIKIKRLSLPLVSDDKKLGYGNGGRYVVRHNNRAVPLHSLSSTLRTKRDVAGRISPFPAAAASRAAAADAATAGDAWCGMLPYWLFCPYSDHRNNCNSSGRGG